MYDKFSIVKISKKELKNELVSLARIAWDSYNSNDEEKFRFHFNYFFNNNKEVREVDYMYDEQFSHPHYHYVLDNYPKLATKIDETLKEQGISISLMKEKFDKIMKDRNIDDENEI